MNTELTSENIFTFICRICLINCLKWSFTLTHFMPLVSYYMPWKHEKTFGFFMFSGGVERNQWHEIGWKCYFFWNIYSFYVERRERSKNEFCSSSNVMAIFFLFHKNIQIFIVPLSCQVFLQFTCLLYRPDLLQVQLKEYL